MIILILFRRERFIVLKQYKNFFTKCFINPDNAKKRGYRYSISYEIKYPSKDINDDKTENIEDTLIFIFMNPSNADKNEGDKTVTRALNYAFNNGYKKLIILNSQPYYDSTENVVGDRKVINENLKHIKEIIQKNQSATKIISTGNPKTRIGADSICVIYRILKKESNVKVFGENNKAFLTKQGYTSHFSPQGLNNENLKKLVDFSYAYDNLTLNQKIETKKKDDK